MLETHGTRHGLTQLAESAGAELYAFSQARVVKLFRQGVPREVVELELHHSRIAHALGIPTPRVDGLVVLDGRTGIVFERCEGPTLFDLIVSRAQPAETLAAAFFDLQQTIHRRTSPALAPLAAKLAGKIQYAHDVPEAARNAARALLQAAPSQDTVCHGDFHPLNVVMSARGALAIEWLDAARGDPALEVARTLLYLEYGHPEAVERDVRAAFLESYARRCREAWAGRLEALQRWRLPVAVARLAEPVDPFERRALLGLIAELGRAAPR